MTVAGSYRRGKATCGDVDILIFHPNIITEAQAKKKSPLKQFVAKLVETCSAEQVSMGKTKYMGLFNWPINTQRILKADIRFVPEESYISALAYFTGSKENNLEMRRKAKKMGFKLNEYGLFDSYGKRISFASEKELFKHLELPYKGPTKR